ncbi:MAG: hypothetical protein ACLQVD_01510 [Capsulimonadaceae bacterium]
MDNCPKCNRKLLSHTSKRCNWCGSEIADRAYQMEAEIKRDIAMTQSQLYGGSGPLYPVKPPVPGSLPSHPAIDRRMEAALEARLRLIRARKQAETNPNETVNVTPDGEGRFEHLEL